MPFSELPYGLRSRIAGIKEAEARGAARTAKLNRTEAACLSRINHAEYRHKAFENRKTAHQMAHLRRHMQELMTYARILRGYRAGEFLLMRHGFRPSDLSDSNEVRRYLKERRLLTQGFAMKQFRGEIEEELYRSSPARSRELEVSTVLKLSRHYSQQLATYRPAFLEQGIVRPVSLAQLEQEEGREGGIAVSLAPDLPEEEGREGSTAATLAPELPEEASAPNSLKHLTRRQKSRTIIASKQLIDTVTLPPIKEMNEKLSSKSLISRPARDYLVKQEVKPPV